MTTLIVRGVAYFALVFGAGFLMGPVRVLWLAPRLGERFAELLEAPIMLAVIVFSSRWLVRRFPASNRLSYLGSGLFALLLVLAAELAVLIEVRGITLSDYISSRDPVAGLVYLCLLLIFSIMPFALSKTEPVQTSA